MGTVIEALTALKPIVAQLEPQPGLKPAAVWVWETEGAQALQAVSRGVSKWPIAVICQDVGNFNAYGQASRFQAGRHDWIANVMLLLAPDPTDYLTATGAAIAATQSLWLGPLYAALRASGNLGGLVERLGNDDSLMEYLIDKLRLGQSAYWGVLFQIPIQQ